MTAQERFWIVAGRSAILLASACVSIGFTVFVILLIMGEVG